MVSLYSLLTLLHLSLLLYPLSTLGEAPYGCIPQDKKVLLQIKSHFKDNHMFSLWNPSDDCCRWPFVGCVFDESSPNHGRVNAVTISGGSGLVGTIPDVIGNLPFLEEIMFFDEPKLTGPIPQSLSKLTHLQIIFLNSNSLSGPIPTFVGKLKKLEQIDISANRFTGSIPPSLAGLTKLWAFNVSRNMLTGPIPSFSSKFKKLDVSSNKLCGSIPKGLQIFNSAAFARNKCLCGRPLAQCKRSTS